MKVIIAGGRDYKNYQQLKRTADHLLQNHPNATILSGGATGADTLAERYAHETGRRLERHPADWKQHGTAAGPIRNHRMAQTANALIAYWDGKSKGTANMIKQAKAANLPTRIIRY